jgi:hypothetical protein
MRVRPLTGIIAIVIGGCATLLAMALIDGAGEPPSLASHHESAERLVGPAPSRLRPSGSGPATSPALTAPSPPGAPPEPPRPQAASSPVPRSGASAPSLEPERASRWEPPAPKDPVFDLDADGRVGQDERLRAAEILALAHQFASNRSLDGSFPILREAFRGEARHFAAMDTDGDGALSVREWVAFHAESIREVRRFDQNFDGALTVAELGALPSRFDFLDAEEADGLLWAWEIDLQRGRGRW